MHRQLAEVVVVGKPVWRGAALAFVIAGLLSGCGGGGGDRPPTGGGGDPTVPTATLTAPADLARGLSGTVQLSANAGDDEGVSSVEFQVDGEPLGAADTTAPYAATLDSTAYASGQHVLRARARDAGGRLSPWSSVTVEFGGSRNSPAGFSLEDDWITGLVRATAFAPTPDGRFFVAEQDGRLRVVKNGTLLAAPFVQLTVNSLGERGLIGVAVDPGFATNGFVYLHYTTEQGTGGIHNRVSRFVANGDVVIGQEFVLLDLPPLSTATNHNGGALHFGADGKLYVGVGDNANGVRAQDLTLPFGKLLRIESTDGSAPPDNPFVGGFNDPRVWAYGLRNPFTFAVQPGTGRIHINDVGASAWEEINLGAAGADYGWPASEGPDDVPAGATGPLFAYAQSDASPVGSGPGGFFTGASVAGGAFYPAGGSFPAAYHGDYFFADFVGSFVGRLDLSNEAAAYAFARVSGNPVDLRVGQDGALYVLTRTGITRIGSP